MRYPALSISLIFFTLIYQLSVPANSTSPQGSLVLEKKTVILIRSGRIARQQPHRKKAIVSFPVVKGGVTDPVVLSRIRSLLLVKNIFETSIEEYRQDTWLSEFDYKVNYNKNFILDITFRQEGAGAYPDSSEKHLAINLKTGRLITVSDVFLDNSLSSLAAMIDKKLQAEMRETVDRVNQDSSIDAEEKSSVPELYKDLKFEVTHLNDFMISEDGITFLYDAGFPHVIQAYQPVGQYKFTYAELSTYLKRQGAPRSLVQ